MYPCLCKNFSSDKPYTCSLKTVVRYQKRISDPMLDRIDIHIEIPRVDSEKLLYSRRGESWMKSALGWRQHVHVNVSTSLLTMG
ncbi:MAG: hypothetical protein HN855_09805 [Anaerolineae bacterium]|jgi:magnesium chelatase family protein|nr:hypothetical protein [Anaerolineae bacterium]MBT7072534.1 hypothetical protein [Anaerolineae bacterium]MBT7325443.1 hypothetical protein [Anaerolineae bacterium]